MTQLAWDQPGDRRYETGVDRGVLYIDPLIALPWNGLTQITEKTSRSVQEYYIDGVKYLDKYVPGSYSATLEAFTYPEEFTAALGLREFAPGVILHDQPARLFHLSYRTGFGNDLEGVDYGYRIHILYNVLAVQSDIAMQTGGGPVNVKPFSWELRGTPSALFGARPTSHISIDSRLIDPDVLEFIENIIYGTELTDPTLPSLVDLLDMIGQGP